MSESSWERESLEHMIKAWVAEQRRGRRWGIFFKVITLLYLIAIFVAVLPDKEALMAGSTRPHAAMVSIDGVISADSKANADSIEQGLQHAFNSKETKGVILAINSPGGSPVQADYVFQAIRHLRQLHPSIPVYAVCSDVCASGAYYIAAAADKVYANPSSLVGSIGALFDGFGFVDAMKKVGVERRLITAGVHKGFLDPFSPLAAEEKLHAQHLVDAIQKEFMHRVEEGRGNRLKKNPMILSGLVWSGREAKSLGLVDGFASVEQVAREKIKVKPIVDYTQHVSPLDQLAERIGASFMGGVASRLTAHIA